MKYSVLLFFCAMGTQISFASTAAICGAAADRALTESPQIKDACVKTNNELVEKQFMAPLRIAEKKIRNKIRVALINHSDPADYTEIPEDGQGNTLKDANGNELIFHANLYKMLEYNTQLQSQANLVREKGTQLCLNEAKTGAAVACIEKIKPKQDFVNQVVVLSTFWAMAAGMPESTVHIDVGDILENGKPLGGDGAFLVQFRDTALVTLGISGDLALIIKNPIHVSAGVIADVEKAAQELGKGLEKTGQDIGKAVEKTGQEVGKVIDKAGREIGNGLKSMCGSFCN